MLTIRLSRVGKKNKPMYRLIISEKTRDPYGRVLEILGSYNPHSKELDVKGDRVNYWLGKGSGMSATVNNLLLEKGIIKGEKVKASIARKKKKGGEEEVKEEKKVEKPAEEVPKTEEKPAEKAEEPKEEAPKEEPAVEEKKEEKAE